MESNYQYWDYNLLAPVFFLCFSSSTRALSSLRIKIIIIKVLFLRLLFYYEEKNIFGRFRFSSFASLFFLLSFSPLDWSLIAGLEYSTLQYHYGIIIAFPFPTNNSAVFTTALAWPFSRSEKDKRTFMIMVIRLHFLCCQQLFES